MSTMKGVREAADYATQFDFTELDMFEPPQPFSTAATRCVLLYLMSVKSENKARNLVHRALSQMDASPRRPFKPLFVLINWKVLTSAEAALTLMAARLDVSRVKLVP